MVDAWGNYVGHSRIGGLCCIQNMLLVKNNIKTTSSSRILIIKITFDDDHLFIKLNNEN